MSAHLQQQNVQSEDEQSQSAGFMTATIRNIFLDSNPHLLILILCNYTLEQLINFRCSCKRFNAFVLLYQGSIVRGVLKQSAYRTAIDLYFGIALPTGLRFNNLVDMTRRCSIAQDVAQLLTRERLMNAGSLGRGSRNAQRRVVFLTARVAKNAYPYVLALLQFFEEYRFRLGSIALDETALLRPNHQVQGLILAKYNQETVIRLCTIYRILQQLLFKHYPRSGRNYLEYFTFAGLESYKYIVYHRVRRACFILDNFSGMTRIHPSITTYDGLSPGALFSRYGSMVPLSDDFGTTSTGLIGTLMPGAADVLNLRRLGRDPGKTQAAFLRWLKRYHGEEPRLLRLEED